MTIVFSTARLLTQVAVLAGAGIIGLAVLSACDTDQTAAEPATPSVSTAPTTAPVAPRTTELPPITATETVESTRSKAPSGATNISDAGDGCAPDIGVRPAAERDITKLRHEFDGAPWQVIATGGAWCGGLSWAAIRASTVVNHPEQLMLYHDGYFQGTGLKCFARQAQDVLSTTTDAVTVSYHVVDDSIPEQRHKQVALGRRVVTFRWNGSRIATEGNPPPVDGEGNC